MKVAARIASVAALCWLLGAAVACFVGRLELDAAKTQMLFATVLWFASAPWALGGREPTDPAS